MRPEPFWADDIRVLFSRHHITDIWIGKRTQTRESKLNAISRFIIVYFALISIYRRSLTPMSMGLVLLLFVVFAHHMMLSQQRNEDPYAVNRVVTQNKHDTTNVFATERTGDKKDDTIFLTPYISKMGSVAKPDNMHRGRREYTPPKDWTTDSCRKPDKSNWFANPNITTIGSSIHPSCNVESKDYDDAFRNYTHNEYDDIFNTNGRRQFYSIVDNNQSKFAHFLYGKH
jgi:hypothetical protein